MSVIVQILKELYEDLIEINNISSLEQCGIFLGEIDNKTIKIVKYVHDKIKKNKTRYTSIRYTKGIYPNYQDYINKNEFFDYIGEWHTHPSSKSYPSYLDNRAMEGLLNHPLYGYPKQLILGIISPNDGLRIFLYKYKKRKAKELKMEVFERQ